MNFQGQVLGANGSPLATGDYTLTFQIFDAVEGGTLIWGPQVLDGAGGAGHGPKIPVVQGYFNVMLGPVDTAGRPLTAAFQAASRFLEIKVNANNPISPRQQILSAPYALNAGSAASVSAGGVNALALAQDVVDRLIPAGTIVAFGGSSAPTGWVLCDGAARNGGDAAFSALFAALGKTYGPGDGSASSFNVPDLRGRTAIGAGQAPGLSNRTLAAKQGTEIETITQVPPHTHNLTGGITSSGAHSHAIRAWLSSGSTRQIDTAGGSTTQFTASTQTDGAHTHTHNLAVQSTGANVTVNNIQPSLVLNYIVKL
jgi:microcystin-dependent protein